MLHKKVLLRFWLPAFVIFCVYLLLCKIYTLAYPYGILYGDSLALYDAGSSLIHPLQIEKHDAARMPVYGFLWRYVAYFISPLAASMWVNFIAFGMTMALWHSTLLSISKSHLKSITMSVATLLGITFSMRVLYLQTLALDDALFCSLATSGLLLSFLGHFHRSSMALFFGMGVLGLAIFTKPIGIALLPLWATFITWKYLKDSNDHTQRIVCAFTCFLLLLGPTALWSVRQKLVYGHLRAHAFGAVHLLANVLPFVQDNDIVLDTTDDNTEFIRRLRRHDEKYNTFRTAYLWEEIENTKGDNPIMFLKLQNNLFVNPNKYPLQYVQNQFELGKLALPIALRIIRLHPSEYLHMVKENFVSFFPLFANGMQSENMEEMYPDFETIETKLPFYVPPAHNSDNPIPSNLLIRKGVVRYCCDNGLRSELIRHKNKLIYAVFILFAFHGFILIFLRRKIQSQLLPVSLLGMLLLTQTMLYFVFTSAAAFPVDRYAAVGEPGILFAAVLGIYSISTLLLRKKHP